ncbi:unnamed protein product [Diamesa tonsa]
MDSSHNMSSTPRRSTRLLQCVTPKSEPKITKIVGPRMMMKLNKSLNKSRKLEDPEETRNNVPSENEATEEVKMEVEEIEEEQKPTAKKSTKRGRKSKKPTTKSLQESSEITQDEKSNINESEISPEVKDTTIYSQTVVLHNVTENVTIDESLAIESPDKSIISPKVATIVEVDSKESKDSTEPKDKVEEEKTETILEKNDEAVETSPVEVIEVVVPAVIETPVEEIKTIEPVEEVEIPAPTIIENKDETIEAANEMICSEEVVNPAPTINENKNETIEPVVEISPPEVETVITPVESIAVVDDSIISSNEVEEFEPAKETSISEVIQDTVPIISDKDEEKIEPVETMDCTEEVQEVALIIESVEKVSPVETMDCSEEVQDVAPSAIKNEKMDTVEEIKRTEEVQDSTPMISDEKDDKIEPVMKNNEIEIKIKIEKDISVTPVEQEVPIKSPVKEVVTRKSESYTIEQLENIEERCESPDLLDESIVTIMDSPPPMNASALPKDSTFSPVVDISINDSRPTIDLPLLKRNNPLRTSTPLAPKLFLKSTENQTSSRKLMLNPLEKSILKSNRRKRSLSMVEGDSFMQKRVMFISPTVMDIESIDHKMMASFIEEKENSIMVTAAASGRRKRSLSETNTTPRAKIVSRVKLPNFNKLHEKQFQKMEDIAEFTKRKAERARKLATPTKPAAVPRIEAPKVEAPKVVAVKVTDQLSKIPTFNKKPVTSEIKIEKAIIQEYKSISNRLGKRSNSVGLEKKTSHEIFAAKKVFKKENPEKKAPGLAKRMKPPTTSLLMRSNSENTHQKRQMQLNPSSSAAFNQKTFDSKLAFSFLNNQDIATNIKKDVSKVQERQDKNMLLYKRNGFNPQEQRKKNEHLLIGVRKNRRFELQMQFRAKQEQEHINDDK